MIFHLYYFRSVYTFLVYINRLIFIDLDIVYNDIMIVLLQHIIDNIN